MADRHAPVPAAWHAVNRAHNLRAYFTADGFRAVPRDAAPGAAPRWEWGLRGTQLGAHRNADQVETVFGVSPHAAD